MGQRPIAYPLLLVAGIVGVLGGLGWGVAGVVVDVGIEGLVWNFVVTVPTFGIAAFAYLRRPDHPSTRRLLAVTAFMGLAMLFDPIALRWVAPEVPTPVEWAVNLGFQLAVAGAVVAAMRLLALYPDGTFARPSERYILAAAWALPLVPLVVAFSSPTLPQPSWVPDPPAVANPFAIEFLAPVGRIAAPALLASQGLFVVAIGLLIVRYRRSDAARRRRIRWLLIPTWAVAVIVAIDAGTVILDPDGVSAVRTMINWSWTIVVPLFALSIVVGLQRQRIIDVDVALRRSLVYGTLWTAIAAVYLGAAAVLGLVAAERFPVAIAVVVTILATLAFQPARRRLDDLADRFVFGRRLSRYEAISRLGACLKQVPGVQELPPRMAETVQAGLALDWVRIVVDVDGGAQIGSSVGHIPSGATPDLVVPISYDQDPLGRIECGPKRDGPVGEGDHALLVDLARQAALGIHNLRLTNRLADAVEVLEQRSHELAASRVRLVRVQEAERRRLERDLHDGAQQDLVALIGHVGLARNRLDRDPDGASQALDDVQAELRRVLGRLRELAHGIHPTVLSDRGLWEAIREQSARSPIPISVRADPELRHQRFPQEIEGAAYFTVTEALANVLKHADAHHAEVSLSRDDGHLRIEIVDDGRGFDPPAPGGSGLANLAERLEALGGAMTVTSRRGAGTRLTARLAVAPPVAGAVTADG